MRGQLSNDAIFGGAYAVGLLTGALAVVAFNLAKGDRVVPQEDLFEQYEQLENQFSISSLKLQQIFQGFNAEMKNGLRGSEGSIRMLPSEVRILPTGEEKGAYLAFDLGSSYFRVLRVILEGQGSFRVEQKQFEIQRDLRSQPAEKLFDFMAEGAVQFLAEHSLDPRQHFTAGLAFSFPVEHTSLSSGTLVEWTKGYSLTGIGGKDIVLLLNQALERKGLRIKVKSLVNDAVGALITRHYANPQCVMSVILGSGTNAAYVEKISEIKKLKKKEQANEMVINLEWGHFDPGRQYLPATCYDLQLDRESSNPGKQVFEKMVSGLYLGEIVRLVCVELIEKKRLFQGRSSDAFQTPYSLATIHLSRVERDHSRGLNDTGNLLSDVMGIPDPDFHSLQIFKRICELVGIRAARLLACGVAAVISKMDKLGGCSVAAEGSLFRDYPHFKSRLVDALTEIFGIQAENILFEPTPEGSGVGAALTAAMSHQVPKLSKQGRTAFPPTNEE